MMCVELVLTCRNRHTRDGPIRLSSHQGATHQSAIVGPCQRPHRLCVRLNRASHIGVRMEANSKQRSATGARVVALVCVRIFMTTPDASIVNIGLPSIATAFGTPLTGSLEWIVIGYLVVIGALLLTFGRLSDMIGRSPIWIAGLVVFTAGSAVCGAAPSLGLLIAARALQGVGSALILSTSTAILSNAVPPTQ